MRKTEKSPDLLDEISTNPQVVISQSSMVHEHFLSILTLGNVKVEVFVGFPILQPLLSRVRAFRDLSSWVDHLIIIVFYKRFSFNIMNP